MISTLYLKLAGAAAVLALVGGAYLYVSHLRSSVETLKTAAVQREMYVNQQTDKIASLGQTLKDQNDAVDALRAEGAARLKQAAADLAVAKRAAVAAKASAQTIFITKPSTPDDLCKSALDLLNASQP